MALLGDEAKVKADLLLTAQRFLGAYSSRTAAEDELQVLLPKVWANEQKVRAQRGVGYLLRGFYGSVGE